MAHPTDYHSIADIHKLKLSNHSHMKTIYHHPNHANILVHNFLRENPNWSIDSLFSYCMKQYEEFGITKSIIAHEVKLYIEEK